LSISDLDVGAFENFIEVTGKADLGVDQKRLLKNWRLMSGNHPTIAGIITKSKAFHLKQNPNFPKKPSVKRW
jgi:hypothetical protein